MAALRDNLHVSVWRGDGSGGAYQDFEVPARPSQSVLDVVSWIQRYAEPTLAYRFACRVGMCGSCAMTVNGSPRWTCRTHVSRVAKAGVLRIAPLRNLPVLRDLATDMTGFFDHWAGVGGVFHGDRSRDDEIARIDPASPQRQRADAGIECINCAVCYAACDTVAGSAAYPGPAALQRAWTLINDERDTARGEILRAVSAPGGCHNCHAMGNCTRTCPMGLDPMGAIAGLKRETLRGARRGKG